MPRDGRFRCLLPKVWALELAYSPHSMGRATYLRVRSSQHPDQVNKYFIMQQGVPKSLSNPASTGLALSSEEVVGTNILVKVTTTHRLLNQHGRT